MASKIFIDGVLDALDLYLAARVEGQVHKQVEARQRLGEMLEHYVHITVTNHLLLRALTQANKLAKQKKKKAGDE